MRLLHLKLLSKFRGLPAGSEFGFDGVELLPDKLEPICLVGLNGSGKSNLLEVICEIFFYLDRYFEAEGKPPKTFATPFGFEITYLLDITFQLARNTPRLRQVEKLTWEGTRETRITVIKEPGALPKSTMVTDTGSRIVDSTNWDDFYLPNHVIAYSSGQNELISNPFIKSNYRYFDLLQQRLGKDLNLELGLNRLFFLDYETSQLATIANYLFAGQNKVDLITRELRLYPERPIDSFSITIHYRNIRNQPIVFPQAIAQAISNLEDCATVVDEVKSKAGKREELKLAFWYDKELQRAFQSKFGSALALFRDLYYLHLLNIHLHPPDTRRKIKNAPSLTYDNLSHLVPVPPRNKLIFALERLSFNKIGEERPIKYKNLSDGEHQMLHVLGSIMLLNTSGSILLYDEPETHFNPEWRSQLITLINKATQEQNPADTLRKQEIFITSHSPFIVSDCRKERVFVFEKGKASNPTINTFGTSVNIITEEVFRKKESIPGLPLEQIENIKNQPLNTIEEVQQAKEAARMLGESVEKVLLFKDLIIREREITGNDPKL